MDPPGRRGPDRAIRFPRACGDGPSRARRRPPETRFPPRLRGWTHDFRRFLSPARVSPALAGMDLSAPTRRSPSARFPRACGDGPRRGRQPAEPDGFPPRLRGWTRASTRCAGTPAVSPALAGMDPRAPARPALRARFPRACGDGPWRRCGSRTRARFPPRLRGWTCVIRENCGSDAVSPALAGMDPGESHCRQPDFGFPRACGDGPYAKPGRQGLPWFPPRLRGWTHCASSHMQPRIVSPALAGMDPRRRACGLSASGFPRACGDGPAPWCFADTAARFPPRLRGWTHDLHPVAEPKQVSPALAGMDRLRTPTTPAYPSFPRACGDGPEWIEEEEKAELFPPRLRGWTVRDLIDRISRGVSPALAGMDPSRRPGRGARWRFPRACGDGPSPPCRSCRP